MISLHINNQPLEVPEGTSVLKAARQLGFEVPALCWNEEVGHINSCMLCLVKDFSTGRVFPSCSAKVHEGMQIITEDEELREARQTGLELLLSEHVGDCEAPCQLGCPAHMNIPGMNRLIAQGNFEESLRVVKRDIALPSVLGRICPAPCEGACHRRTVDQPVSICMLKMFVGDMNDVHPWPVPPLNGKRVAVVGAGPAGLSAAYYLRMNGVEPTLFDQAERPGGQLVTAISKDVLPQDVLEREIQTILDTGVIFKGGLPVGDEFFNHIRSEYDAIIVATGNINDLTKSFQLNGTPKGLEVNKDTYETSEPGIFAVGNVIRSSRLAIRSLGQGKEAAYSVLQYLQGLPVIGEPRLFNSRFGKLHQLEFAEYLKEAHPGKRLLPDSLVAGFSPEQAMEEAARCLHCDCRAIDNCLLREWSDHYHAVQKRFQTSPRRPVTKHFQTDGIVYEPQKCIKCGICVKLTEKHSEEFGLTFIGRGFDVVVGVPYNEHLDKGLQKIAIHVAKACPTGALSERYPEGEKP
jgi:NADPH-dependent glutamate synthase beta subunit-like oxidoreductase